MTRIMTEASDKAKLVHAQEVYVIVTGRDDAHRVKITKTAARELLDEGDGFKVDLVAHDEYPGSPAVAYLDAYGS